MSDPVWVSASFPPGPAASPLEQTLRWRRGEADPPYPLAEGCQDQLLSLAIGEAAATGLPVTTRREPWAAALARG